MARLINRGWAAELYDEGHTGFVAHRAGEMSLVSFRVCLGILILTEGKISRPHHDALSVHGFHKPVPGQRDDPLGFRIFVPLTHPADGKDRHHDAGTLSLQAIQPLWGGRGFDAFKLEAGEFFTRLMAYPVVVRPDMPIAYGGRRRLIIRSG